jgi:hypothetical protein
MYDLSTFGLSEMTMVGAALRRVGSEASSIEETSQRAARLFCDKFVDPASGRSAFALARCYATLSLEQLPDELARFARGVFPDQPLAATTQCMTLLGSYGDKPAWQTRRGSTGHQAIPLATVAVLESLPMVARLTASLGLNAEQVVHPDPTFLLEKDRQGFNVFHVETALGSPYIPAQASFVDPLGVRSVVGFGFVLPPTHVYAVILFSREHISARTAALFKTLALNLKLALLPFAAGRMFAGTESG